MRKVLPLIIVPLLLSIHGMAQNTFVVGTACYFYPSMAGTTQIPYEISVIYSKEGIIENYQYPSRLLPYTRFSRVFKQQIASASITNSHVINKVSTKIEINAHSYDPYPKGYSRIKYNGLTGEASPAQLTVGDDFKGFGGGCLVFARGAVPRRVINIATDDYLSIREKPIKNSKELLRVKNNNILWKTEKLSGDYIEIQYVILVKGVLQVQVGYVFKKYLSVSFK